MEFINVTCALIRKDGELLVARRGFQMDQAGKWEFPGGKVKAGESDEACLIRELKEELGVIVAIDSKLTPVEYHYPGKAIRLIPFICEIVEGEPYAHEHDGIKWAAGDELTKLEWSGADIPVLNEYLALVKR
ncbi:(deoxy)nucleoside triphosphate pyrophosphohydrolase [Marinilabiliaceae bacterium JC017]|nr:(deoxy)nucleoside triphosphate pyrophosphohydrolase [Marinilabiliaceae bacterium JC017]